MQHLLERLHLIQSAQAVLRERHLLIEAAAGYGKSVLLNQIVSYLPNAAYLRLTIDDNDAAVLKQRVNTAAADTLIFDDVHLISAESESAAFLASQLATGDARHVLAGRHFPLDVAPLIASNAAVRWDTETLAFSSQTTAQLLQDDDPQWQQTLAGWPMGVALLQQIAPSLRKTGLANAQLFDYLAQAVFEGLEQALQRFLCITAVPIEFSAELAAHLLDITPDKSAALIQALTKYNLFLRDGIQPNTFAYHDLFRAFLQTKSTEADRQAIALCTIAFHNAHYSPNVSAPAAIFQAFDVQMYEQALALLLNIDWEFLTESNRYRTFYRWVMALPEPIRNREAALLWITGHCLWHIPGRFDDAIQFYEQSEAVASEAGDLNYIYASRLGRVSVLIDRDGASQSIVDLLKEIHQNAPQREDTQLPIRSAQRLSTVLGELGRFSEARAYSKRGLRLVQQTNAPEIYTHRLNYNDAIYNLVWLGEFAEARAIFEQALAFMSDNDGESLEALVSYYALLVAMGDWEQMSGVRQQIDAVAQQLELFPDYFTITLSFCDAMLLIARQDAERADGLLNIIFEHDTNDMQAVLGNIGRINLVRLTGKFEKIRPILNSIKPHQQNAPFYVAYAHLEADIGLGLEAIKQGQPFTVSAETLTLYRIHARAELVRLRALLTVLCHRQHQPRWRRHARRALSALAYDPHYPNLLIKRDPELGAWFWTTLLQEQIAPAQAADALVNIGRLEPLHHLLHSDAPELRQQAAGVLAKMGDETAMGVLGGAISAEKDKPTKAILQSALATLETSPPPLLHIKLMGSFHVQRGDVEISDFHRPVVTRLLQYFAVNHRRSIPRDQILEDLWPDTTPDKAWTTFRTVYSRLRNTLEPHMRSKGPNRYFVLDGDSYTFDPHGYTTTDIGTFETTISDALGASQQISESARQRLDGYAMVLPDLPYADWLLETRERVQELYVNGSLRVGQELLARGESAEAQQWAQRVLRAAPWLEAGWQLLMRAYSRQNLRSRALRTYQDAEDALQNELAVEPSPLTIWLHKRLQAGETI